MDEAFLMSDLIANKRKQQSMKRQESDAEGITAYTIVKTFMDKKHYELKQRGIDKSELNPYLQQALEEAFKNLIQAKTSQTIN